MGGWRVTFVVALIVQGAFGALPEGLPKKKVLCEFYDSNSALTSDGIGESDLSSLFQSEGGVAENASDSDVNVDVAKKMMVCGRGSQFCYALWTTGTGGTSASDNETVDVTSFVPKFLKQGCWEASPPSGPGSSDKAELPKSSAFCQRSNCTSYYKKNERLPQMHFCCCQGDYCNAEVLLEAVEDDEDGDEELDYDVPLSERLQGKNMVYLSLAVIAVILITVVLGLGVAKVILSRRKWKNGGSGQAGGGLGDEELGDDQQEEERLISHDFMNLIRFNKNGDYDDTFDLKLDIESILDKEIAAGRWGRIFSTKKNPESGNQLFANKSLALKIYSQEHREFFENEKFVYECIGKENDNILKYYGWTESPTAGLVLAFEFVDYNLREFLKTHPLSCQELVDILLGISRGVAYLHTGVAECSTAVAHRDLTSRNVLIDPRTKHIYIADFGLSLLTRGAKYYWGGRERQAEFCSLAEAGTLRYMAPELLEGAVNLKDCENALKQADVYSLSLILWEAANTCADLKVAIEDNNETPTTYHSLPFDEEAGNKDVLNLDDVVRLVVQNRIRPGFHTWSDMGLTRALRDTLNESWDSEPDARLTSLCIVERIQEMKNSLSNKYIAKGSKALEKKRVVFTEEPAWINRNPCMERNLLFDNASGSVTDTNSVVTVATNLSSGGGSTDGSRQEHKFINNVALSQQQQPGPPPIQLQSHFNPPKAIQLIQNIRK